ncbi:hypothetical protein [Pantoea sp. ARC270]|uniref:hypothetical protein n=1 Tax=Pantoea sp. ARC270 TaxID=2027923 RepID=UPI001F3A8379|nr:hypothetical protein [Pantoea sp. ARC270]
MQKVNRGEGAWKKAAAADAASENPEGNIMRLLLQFFFGALYLITGYVSFQAVLHYASCGHSGVITEMRSYLVAPLLCALFWLLFYLVAWWSFRKIALLSVAKETAFQLLFFLANNVCLAGLTLFSVPGRKAALNTVQLMKIDVTDFAWIYLASAAITLVVFALIRRRWA